MVWKSRVAAAGLGMTLVIAGCGDQEPEAICSRSQVALESGLAFEDLECGSGRVAGRGHSLTVDYTGRLRDGTTFQSTSERKPFTFRLGVGQVIAGWDEGLLGMSVGGKRVLTIPPELGFGSAGLPPDVPPNATLIFEVDLLSVREPEV